MHRFLFFSAGCAFILAVMSTALWLLGYTIGGVVSAVIAVPMFTIVIMLALIFAFAIAADLLISLLVFSMKTWGKNSARLRLATRWLIVNTGDPSDLFFIVLLIVAGASAIQLTAAIRPSVLTSPGIGADLALSGIFWLLFNVVGILADS